MVNIPLLVFKIFLICSDNHRSQLQTLFCDGCAAILGFRCIETPVNHVLDEYVPWLLCRQFEI